MASPTSTHPDTDISPDPFAVTQEERRQMRKLLKRKGTKFSAQIDTDASLPLYLTPQTLEVFFNDLGLSADRHWRLRTLSAWMLGVAEIPDGMQSRVKTRLAQVLSNHAPSSAEQISLAIFLTCGVSWLAISSQFILGFYNYLGKMEVSTMFAIAFLSAIFALLPTFFLFPVMMPLAISIAKRRNNRARVMAVKSLYRLNALEAMPELLAGAFDKSRKIREVCRQTLQRFLPQITENNLTWLPSDTEVSLGRILRNCPECAFGEPILDYLERFGLGASLPAVEKYQSFLASHTHLPEYRSLQENCERIIPLLQARQASITQRESLLRHSFAPEVQPDQLLRPVAHQYETQSEQLLRSSQE